MLKLTRLCLHSLKGGSPTGYYRPLRRRRYQRTRSSIPPPQRQWRKRNHGSLKRWPPETRGIPQSPSPEGYHSSTNPTPGCTAPPQDFHWSTFSFSESRTAFSFAVQKKKRFWPPLGKRKNNPQPGRQKIESPLHLVGPKSALFRFRLRRKLHSAPLSLLSPQKRETAFVGTPSHGIWFRRPIAPLPFPVLFASSPPAPDTTPPSLLQQGPAS